MNSYKEKGLVYICSPLGAETEEQVRVNMAKAKIYMDIISKRYNCRAIAPHAILPQYLDDHIPEERELGLKFGLDLLKICKKMVVCGTVISPGMKKEIELAENLGMEVIYLDIPKKPLMKITVEFEGDEFDMHI